VEKWRSGEVGKWGSGEVGKWGSGVWGVGCGVMGKRGDKIINIGDFT